MDKKLIYLYLTFSSALFLLVLYFFVLFSGLSRRWNLGLFPTVILVVSLYVLYIFLDEKESSFFKMILKLVLMLFTHISLAVSLAVLSTALRSRLDIFTSMEYALSSLPLVTIEILFIIALFYLQKRSIAPEKESLELGGGPELLKEEVFEEMNVSFIKPDTEELTLPEKGIELAKDVESLPEKVISNYSACYFLLFTRDGFPITSKGKIKLSAELASSVGLECINDTQELFRSIFGKRKSLSRFLLRVEDYTVGISNEAVFPFMVLFDWNVRADGVENLLVEITHFVDRFWEEKLEEKEKYEYKDEGNPHRTQQE